MTGARIALALGLLAGPAAAATTFDVDVPGPFVQTGGSLTGFFTIDDEDGDGLIEARDVIAWSFTGAGFVDDVFNATLSGDGRGQGVASRSKKPSVDIGGGLRVEAITFSGGDPRLIVEIDFLQGLDVAFSSLATPGTVFTSSALSVTERAPVAPIPLPATLPALAVALVALVAARRRRR